MQESKQNQRLAEAFFTEMPMRPEGDPDQYASRHVSPYAPTTAKDGYVGRSSKNLNDVGADIDKELRQQSWDQAVSDRPELGIHTQVNNAMRQDKKADNAAAKELGLASREGDRTRGGRMIQTNKTTGDEDIEAKASTNRGLPALISKIDQLKAQITELRPQVKSWYDPKLLQIMRELYQATTIFIKHGMLRGPKADEIRTMHDAMEDLLNKAKQHQEPVPRSLDLDDI